MKTLQLISAIGLLAFGSLMTTAVSAASIPDEK